MASGLDAVLAAAAVWLGQRQFGPVLLHAALLLSCAAAGAAAAPDPEGGEGAEAEGFSVGGQRRSGEVHVMLFSQELGGPRFRPGCPPPATPVCSPHMCACASAVATVWGKAQTGSVSLADEKAEARAEAKAPAPPDAAAEEEACASARATLSQQVLEASTRAWAVAVAKALLAPPPEEADLQGGRGRSWERGSGRSQTTPGRAGGDLQRNAWHRWHRK